MGLGVLGEKVIKNAAVVQVLGNGDGAPLTDGRGEIAKRSGNGSDVSAGTPLVPELSDAIGEIRKTILKAGWDRNTFPF